MSNTQDAKMIRQKNDHNEITPYILKNDSKPQINGIGSFIECVNLGYSIKEKEILKDINIVIPPGKLVALMGPSGAGKTTLLNQIAGRGRGKQTGSIKLNRKDITVKLMRHECKVVPQHDILTSVFTARQILEYTAALVLPKTENHKEKIDEVIDLLSLKDSQHVQVGGVDFKGLSGGQLKRVSIAMELLSNPSVLMLDEPTSGLDSKIAEDVVDCLVNLAESGRTICCTIHQPSFQVFQKFDWLVLLDKGKVAYNGDVSKLPAYLKDIQRPCPEFVNPADHIMAVLSETIPRASCDDFNQLFESTEFGKYAKEDMRKQIELCDYRLSQKIEETSVKYNKRRLFLFKKKMQNLDGAYATSFWSQMITIFKRSVHFTILDKGQLRMRMAQILVMGLVMASIFWRLPNTQDRVNDRLSALFMFCLFLGMSSIMGTAMAYPVEKAVMLREVHNGYYNIFAYYIGRISVLLLFQVLYGVIFAAAVYFAVGLYNSANKFFIFLITLTLSTVISGLAGFLAGVIFDSPQKASNVIPMIIMPLTIFAGLFIPYDNLPVYWIWVWYISYFQYSIQIMMVNEFDDTLFDPCTVEQIKNKAGSCPYGSCSSNNTDPQSCSGMLVLDQKNYNPDDMSLNFGILAIFVFVLFSLSALALRRAVNKRI